MPLVPELNSSFPMNSAYELNLFCELIHTSNRRDPQSRIFSITAFSQLFVFVYRPYRLHEFLSKILDSRSFILHPASDC